MIFGTAYDMGDGTFLFFPDQQCLVCNGQGKSGKRVVDDEDGEVWFDTTDLVTCEACSGYGWMELKPEPAPFSKVPGFMVTSMRAFKHQSDDRIWEITDLQTDPLGVEAKAVLGESPTRIVRQWYG